MQGERQRVSFPRVCTTLRSLLKCPRGQQCVFDQAPGVLPVRRETIEGIGGGRMQCVHPAGVPCGTRCQVETCRNSHVAAGCNACIRLVCNAAHGARSRPVETVTACRGMLCTMPPGCQLRLGPGGCNACIWLVCNAAHGARGHCMQGHAVHSISGAPAAAGPRGSS